MLTVWTPAYFLSTNLTGEIVVLLLEILQNYHILHSESGPKDVGSRFPPFKLRDKGKDVPIGTPSCPHGQ